MSSHCFRLAPPGWSDDSDVDEEIVESSATAPPSQATTIPLTSSTLPSTTAYIPLTSSTLSSTTSSVPLSSSTLSSTIFSVPRMVSSPPVRFAPPKTDEEIAQERQKGIPKRTLQDTKYCVTLWDEWRKSRQHSTGEEVDAIEKLTEEQLDHWLTRFILEVRKKDGTVYPPNTLHHITAGLMRHIRLNGKPHIDLFKSSNFTNFRASLDAEMKSLQRKGIGSRKRQAEILTEEEEELLWQKGFLGKATPTTLLDTIIFYNGLYFALRSGVEHRHSETLLAKSR